jgi:excisionase family DNA binding protein
LYLYRFTANARIANYGGCVVIKSDNGNGKHQLSVAEIINDPDKLTLTIEETAKILRISTVFTYQQLKAGNIPAYKLGKSKYIISKARLLDMINSNGHELEAVNKT